FHAELRRVETYVTKTLHNNFFAFDARSHSAFLHVLRLVQRFTDTKENTLACCFSAALNTTLSDWFTGHATQRIQIVVFESCIRICNPCHLTRTASVIRSRNVNRWSDHIFLDQLSCVTTCDALHLARCVLLRLHLDTTFRSSERNVNNSTLKSHQRSKCFYFIFIYKLTVTDTTFRRCLVMRVLNTDTFNYLYLPFDLDREIHFVNGVTDFNLVQQSGFEAGKRCSFIEVRKYIIVKLTSVFKIVFHLYLFLFQLDAEKHSCFRGGKSK